MKDKIDTFIKRKGVEITYENGSLVKFNNTNIDVIEPHKIIIETSDIQLLLLYYGNYAENKNKFYLYDLSCPISWTGLQELVKSIA